MTVQVPIDFDALDWNPRYVAYAQAHGKTPTEMLELDREQWPGGCMTGFVTWKPELAR